VISPKVGSTNLTANPSIISSSNGSADITGVLVISDSTQNVIVVDSHNNITGAGNFLGGGSFSTPKTTNLGDTFQIAIGDLDITLD